MPLAPTVEPDPCLITGVAGLVGSTLADRLLARGGRVVGLDNFNSYYNVEQKRANVAHLAAHPRFTLIEGDIRDAERVEALFAAHKPVAVAHLAAMANVRYSIGRAPLYTDVNITGTVNLLEAARRHDACPFVFASTSSVYGRTQQIPFVETDTCDKPLSAYPATKRAGELLGYTYHNLHGMHFTALRFFSVYGPRARPDMMPYMVTDRVCRGEPVTLYNGGQMKRDWTYVDDIVDGVARALERPMGCELINLGRGEPVWMADFVAIVERLVGRPAVLETPPAPASEPAITWANIDKARDLLGYDPKTPIAEGLAALWNWYRDANTSAVASR